MEEITTFFAMGGYAAFVWPSLGLTLAIMAGLLIATLRQLRRRQRRLAEMEASGAVRRRRTAMPAAPAGSPSEAREARP
jgi:heme exporter protein D